MKRTGFLFVISGFGRLWENIYRCLRGKDGSLVVVYFLEKENICGYAELENILYISEKNFV